MEEAFHAMWRSRARQLLASDRGGSTDVFVGEVIIVALLVGLLLLQYAFGLADEYGRRHRHFRELLARGYKETAILGMAAFVLFIIETAHVTSNETVLSDIEGLHISVWVLARE
jgi:uncharacterized membrane protein